MKKITPCLWFDGRAEEAAKFYVSIVPGSKITGITRYGETGPGKKGSVLTVTFRLAGQDFIALNGGPHYKFSEAISFSIDCKTQKEVDTYWRKLTKGGEEGPCGWLKDKFGVSWQIVPSEMKKIMSGKNAKKSGNAMRAMMQMKKLDIAALQAAYDRG